MRELKGLKTRVLSLALAIIMSLSMVIHVYASVGSSQSGPTTDQDGIGSNGVTSFNAYVAQPAVFVSAILVDANTTQAAESYIQSNVLSLYDVAPTGAMYTPARVPAELSSSNCSSTLRSILQSFVGTGKTNEFWKASTYDTYWAELISVLHNVGACSEAAWQHYQSYGTADNHGKKVVIIFEQGFYTYKRKGEVNDLATAKKYTYGNQMGSAYSQAYGDFSSLQANLINMHNSGSINLKNGTTREIGPLGWMISLTSSGSASIASNAPDWGGALCGTNFVTTSGGYYFGRGYWIPGQGTLPQPPGDNSLPFTYEVLAEPNEATAVLNDGKAQTTHFRIGLNATENVKSLVSNSSGTYTVTITPRAANNVQNNSPTGTGTWIASGAYPIDDMNLIAHPVTGIQIDNKYTFTVTPEVLVNIFNGSYWPHVRMDVSDPTTANATDLWKSQGFNVTITHNKTGGFGTSTGTPGDVDYIETEHKNTPGDYGADYSHWKDGSSVKDIPWQFHSETSVNIYAEVVANQVGYLSNSGIGSVDRYAQDWNVNAGIPSTENLSVAVGGQSYLYDLAGMIGTRGTSYSGTPNNTGNGTSMGGVVTRNIKFNVIINDWWGDSNTPCSLSCPGHSASGGNGASAYTSNGTAVTSSACPYCGQTVTAQGQDKVPASGTPGKPGYNPGSPAVPDSKTCGCSYTLTYYCSTDTATCAGASVSKSTSLSNDQRYSGSVTATCPGGATLSVSTEGSLLCDGYTTGKGCVHSGNTNCAHRTTKTVSFTINEELDCYAYRTITNAKVYNLADATITAVNTNVVENSAINQSVSNTNQWAYLWRAKGDYKSNGTSGRLWFTQFVNPTYSSGWISTSCVNTTTNDATNIGYWLGDCTITMNVYADHTAADTANPSALDSISTVSNRGSQTNNYNAETAGPDNYKSNNGDKLSDAQCTNLALHVVNAWQAANSGNYTVMVISDTLATGMSMSPTGTAVGDMHNSFQNVIADVYAVDGGIPLFNAGFTASGETHYRSHKSVYAHTSLNGLLYGNAFSLRNVNESRYSNMVTGYAGTPNGNPLYKYGVTTGTIKTRPKLLVGMLEYSSTGTLDGASAAPLMSGFSNSGGIQTTTSGAPYGDETGKTLSKEAGLMLAGIVTSGSSSTQTFAGYYNTHTYPNVGSYTVKGFQGLVTQEVLFSKTVTNNGNANAHNNYSANGFTNYTVCPMTISNIDLKDTAQNGAYTQPVTVMCNYRKIIEIAKNDASAGYVTDRASASLTQKANYSASTDGTNTIIIHNPISVEYCNIIGNGSGDYASYVKDESGEDMRTPYLATTEDQEKYKNNYIVTGNTFHLWFSDIGDFYDSNGSWDHTSPQNHRGVGNVTDAYNGITGVKQMVGSMSASDGYANNMLTSKWVKSREVAFSFPISYVDLNDNTVLHPAGQWLDLSNVKCTKANGSLAKPTTGNMQEPSNALQEFINANPTTETGSARYGWDFEFTCLHSAVETTAAQVWVRTTASNAPADLASYAENNATRAAYLADHQVIAKYTVEIVGLIGNLALEDVGDFRFSNLFKKANGSWLIDNIIQNVNADEPNIILSTQKDLLLNNATTYNHNTTSVNTVSKGNQAFLGKAGDWLKLPLTASINNVEEFKQEQMRLGYTAYFDIETMGNYYGVNEDDAGILDLGPLSTEELRNSGDNRPYVMTITPHYVLYDYENKTYHEIDLYSGKQGAYTRYWSDGLALTEDVAGLYINVADNAARWNVGSYEQNVTLNIAGNSTTAFSGDDFIGTASKIILDAADRSYIGSSALYGSLTYRNNALNIVSGNNTKYLISAQANTYNGSLDNYSSYKGSTLAEKDFGRQTQRWYFALGLPSSTYIVPQGTDSNSQASIENAHEQLKSAHPHSVVLAYATIKVKGTVWELTYDFETVNGNTKFTLFEDVESIPSSVANPSSIKRVIDPATDCSSITSEMVPLLVMDAWNTSADDWDTYGTH